jgi:flagellar basal body-associated protein FliL
MKGRIPLIFSFCIIFALFMQLASSETEITVTEGDIVNLSVASEDPDNENVFVTFTEPVNNKGIWQTEIGDAGTYHINISVCDREFCDSDLATITVLKKVFPPVITSYSPEDLSISAKEGYSILFSVGVEDEDSSKIYLSWKFDGQEVSTGLSFKYDTDFYSAGMHTLEFTVSDGEVEDKLVWDINILDINAPPVLDEIEDITIVEGSLVKISPMAIDPDYDDVTYTISDPVGNDGEWQTGFDDAGTYDITVKASDGILADAKTVRLKVENMDRLPVITEYAPLDERIYAKEGDEISFSIRATDIDGDDLSYVWKVDGAEVGYKKAMIYSLGYDSAGIRTVECVIDDGTIKTIKKWVIIVEDINQPPVLELEESYFFDEGDLVKIVANATDYDDDDITYYFSEPLDENGEWQTDYRSSGAYVSNISAYDGFDMSSMYVKIIVKNVDVPIVFGNISKFYADEGTRVSVRLEAYNPGDEDITFSSENLPEIASIEGDRLVMDLDYDTVKRNTGWFGRMLKAIKLYSLVFSDSETFKMKINAEAGNSSSSKNIKVVVSDVNRVPEIMGVPSSITAEEGDLIKINYEAYDEDNDALKTRFSKPFNKKGEWQTKYGDAGEYIVLLNVDDNMNTTSRAIRVIVEKKNRAPVISIDEHIKVSAGKEIRLDPVVTDPDKDDVTVTYSGWFSSDSYQTTENDTGMHFVTVYADDGTDTVSKDVTIEVKEPGLLWFYLKYILLGLLLLLLIILLIMWIEGKTSKKSKKKSRKEEKEDRYPWEEVEVEEGKGDKIREIKSQIFADKKSKKEDEKMKKSKEKKSPLKWIIAAILLLLLAGVFGAIWLCKDNVQFHNINDVKIKEGEPLSIEFKTKNADRIDVYATPEGAGFSNTTFVWTPTFRQAGVYKIKAVAYNNQSNKTQEFKITVINVNRAPNITYSSPADSFTANTSKKVLFRVITMDRDNDNLTYTWYFGPWYLGLFDRHVGGSQMNRTFTIPGEKKVKVRVCDKEDCVYHVWEVKVIEYIPRIISTPRTYVITETKDTAENKTAAAAAGAGNRTTYVIYGSGSADAQILVPEEEGQETTQYVINNYDIDSYDINGTEDGSVIYVEDYVPKNNLIINTYTIG